MAATRKASAAEPPAPVPPRPPRLDRRPFRHELTPVWLQTAATLAGEEVDAADTLGRVAWFGCQAWVTPAVVAAVHPSASVRVWDPDPARLARVAAVRRHAGLANLEVHERRSPPDASLHDRFDLVVVDGLVDSTTDVGRERLVAAAASLLRPGGFLVVSYRTVVGWGEVAPLVRLLRRTIAEGTAHGPREVLAPLQVLRSRGAAYPAVRPAVGAWLDELLEMSPAEAIGTWGADDLRPLSHAQVSHAAAAHGAEFVTSAHVHDPLVSAPTALARQVRASPTAVLRESLTDLAVRRTRRIDLFRLGRSTVDERARSRAVQRLAMVATRLDVAESVGAGWAEPGATLDGVAATEGADPFGRRRQALRTGATRVGDLWPGEPPKRREVLTRAALGAGLLHPVARTAAAPVPVEALAAATRLTDALARRGHAEANHYSVAPVIGTAVPSTYAAALDDQGRRALGIGAP
jgi:SAM-dependent methyltransferase